MTEDEDRARRQLNEDLASEKARKDTDDAQSSYWEKEAERKKKEEAKAKQSSSSDGPPTGPTPGDVVADAIVGLFKPRDSSNSKAAGEIFGLIGDLVSKLVEKLLPKASKSKKKLAKVGCFFGMAALLVLLLWLGASAVWPKSKYEIRAEEVKAGYIIFNGKKKQEIFPLDGEHVNKDGNLVYEFKTKDGKLVVTFENKGFFGKKYYVGNEISATLEGRRSPSVVWTKFDPRDWE